MMSVAVFCVGSVVGPRRYLTVERIVLIGDVFCQERADCVGGRERCRRHGREFWLLNLRRVQDDVSLIAGCRGCKRR